MNSKTPRQVARILTDHHNSKCAGFYPSTGGRGFLARVKQGRLEVSYDFKFFHQILPGTVFYDHNGRPIVTYSGEA